VIAFQLRAGEQKGGDASSSTAGGAGCRVQPNTVLTLGFSASAGHSFVFKTEPVEAAVTSGKAHICRRDACTTKKISSAGSLKAGVGDKRPLSGPSKNGEIRGRPSLSAGALCLHKFVRRREMDARAS